MGFPKFKNKHLEDAIFNPGSSLDLGKIPEKIPKRFVLMYSEDQLRYLKKKYNPQIVKGVSKELYQLFAYQSIGIVKINGIGSPHVTAILDDLIFLGGKVFLNIGCAGGLQHEGIFLCDKALRDEGTSYHYLPHGEYSYPDKELTSKLGIAIEKVGIAIEKVGLDYEEGASWTIDAPYRETFKEAEHYRKKGILTVDMEVSALFAVAEYRKVRMAAAFVVSDILGRKREVINNKYYQKSLNKLTDAAIDCLISSPL